MNKRRAGILVHPTSLPGPFGAGDLGPQAVRFADWAAEAGMSVWQVLPLGPVGPDLSPYSGLSAFAGNPLLISPERLEQQGLLPRGTVDDATGPGDGAGASGRTDLLRRSWEFLRRRGPEQARRELRAFCDDPVRAAWLDDWALFAALRERNSGRPWFDWSDGLRLRRAPALEAARRELSADMDYQRYLQFLFYSQWSGLRAAARLRGIELLGDVPIYVAHDSADVWARPDLFQLDEQRRPLRVAGVPPDYFSETGQLWGNPLFRWDVLAREDFAWWVARIESSLERTDRVRLDHFRGFAAYWEVDAAAATAADGRWVPGPGAPLFEAIRKRLGRLPFVAEDLGVITEDVTALRCALGLPGMRVLQFGIGPGGDPEHHPDRVPIDCVVYTGTHDNDTLRGWFESLGDDARRELAQTLGVADSGVPWRIVEVAYGTAAELAVIPVQDALELGAQARMNRPGTLTGNWSWRIPGAKLTLRVAARLRKLAERTGRLPARD